MKMYSIQEKALKMAFIIHCNKVLGVEPNRVLNILKGI
jgi:hypothetical protein